LSPPKNKSDTGVVGGKRERERERERDCVKESMKERERLSKW
jgi:hypothetical protein